MTTILDNIKAQQDRNGLPRDAQRRRRRVEVRRVAVIRPEGAHFNLQSIRVQHQAAEGQ